MLNQSNSTAIKPADEENVRFQPNTIYCGDCKDILRHFPENSIDLIYLDPPFFSNRHYEVIWNDGYELRAFEDRWKGGMMNYVGWMVERLNECYRLLKESGSMYVHCDWHASHYLRVELDKIFGGERFFVNEIVWKRSIAHSDTKQGSRHYGRLHDTILFYVRNPKEYVWNQQYTAYDRQYIDTFYKHIELPDGTTRLLTQEELSNPNMIRGRRFQTDNLTAAKPGGDTLYDWHGKKPYKGRYWAYSKFKMEQFEKEGRLIYTSTGMPRYKRYLDEMLGVALQDFWNDINSAGMGGESLGYPTQKPEALMERIIKSSSKPTDIVLDPFCGCGTAIVAAHKLSRRWVGIDVSPTACKLMRDRMERLTRKKVLVIGLPQTIEELKQLHHFEFQNWVFDKLHGRINPKMVGDLGIDGWLELSVPTQVKQAEHVGRVDVDKLETAVERFYGYASGTKGVLIGFSFTKDAYDEVARVRLSKNMDIRLMTVQEILNTT